MTTLTQLDFDFDHHEYPRNSLIIDEVNWNSNPDNADLLSLTQTHLWVGTRSSLIPMNNALTALNMFTTQDPEKQRELFFAKENVLQSDSLDELHSREEQVKILTWLAQLLIFQNLREVLPILKLISLSKRPPVYVNEDVGHLGAVPVYDDNNKLRGYAGFNYYGKVLHYLARMYSGALGLESTLMTVIPPTYDGSNEIAGLSIFGAEAKVMKIAGTTALPPRPRDVSNFRLMMHKSED